MMKLNDEQKVMLELNHEWSKLIKGNPELTKLRERNNKKAMAEVIRQGRLQELKDVIRANPGCSIMTSEQGNLVVMAIIGKRLLRRNEIVFQLLDEQSSFESIVKIKHDALISFLTQQQKFNSSIVFDKNMAGRDVFARNKERFEVDSKLYLAAKMLSQCEIIQSNSYSQDAKLFAAHELGILFTRFSTLTQNGRTQEKIAKHERKKGLTAIFDKLKAMKNGGQKPRDLWTEFVSMLKEENQTFDRVEESANNPANCKSWSVTFSIIPDKDGAGQKEQTISYERFTRRLNEN